MRGKVLFLNKTYGFIRSDEVEKDIFFHFSSILKDGYKTVERGTLVEFDLKTDDKGVEAVNIKEVLSEDGKETIIIKIYKHDNCVVLDDFYFSVITKMAFGLKYLYIVGENMICTSHTVKEHELKIISEVDNYEKRVTIDIGLPLNVVFI